MTDQPTTKLPRWREWGVILLIFVAAVFGSTWLGKMGTRETNVSAALVVAVGTAALAAFTRRYSRFPVWASVTSVLLLAASAIGSAALWPDAAAWHHDVSGSLWMHPWYFLTLISVSGQARGVCAVASRTGAWILLSGAFAIAIITPAIAVLP
jgi:hypothetical protein